MSILRSPASIHCQRWHRQLVRRAGRLQLEEAGHRHREGREHRAGPTSDTSPFQDGRAKAIAAVDDEAGEREQQEQPQRDAGAGGHGVSLEEKRGWMHQPCSRLMSCRSSVWL